MVCFKLVKTEDGSGEYWTPVDHKGNYHPGTVAMLDGMGYPPDTNGWIEPPEMEGWYSFDSIGAFLYDLSKKGLSVTFLGA